MNDELKSRITAYRTALSIVKSMIDQGIISKEDYRIIDTILTEKYGLSSCTIFR